jgi:hypothetical protein
MKIPDKTRDTAATIIPSVGCPMGCNFCTTSAFFGGKGKVRQLLRIRRRALRRDGRMEQSMKVSSFFMMDENFLLNRPRAMQLLDRMKKPARAGRCMCSRRPTRSASTPSRNWFNSASRGSGSAWSRRNLPTQSCTTPTPRNWLPNCASTASSCWARPSSGWNITRWKTFARKSSSPSGTEPTSTSSCCTRRSRARRSSSRCKTKAA